MPNLVAQSLMVSGKKIFKDFQYFLSFVAMAARVFEGIKFFQEILKRQNHFCEILVSVAMFSKSQRLLKCVTTL